MTDSTDRDACPTPRWLVSPFFPTVKRPPADTSPANARGGARRASDLVIVRLPARTAARFSRRSLRLVPRGAAADLLSAMFVAGNPSSLVGSPRHDGGKRRHPGASGVAYRSTGCGPVSASSTVAGSHGMSASLSTPVHFPKCARADASTSTRGRGVSHQPGDDRNSGARVGCLRPTHADAGERSRGPESPLRSRRALPSMSLSVGAANEDILQGRPGIVYIDGTKMPQDGWYQRVRARGRCLEKNKKTKGARLALFLCSCFLFSFCNTPWGVLPRWRGLPPASVPSPFAFFSCSLLLVASSYCRLVSSRAVFRLRDVDRAERGVGPLRGVPVPVLCSRVPHPRYFHERRRRRRQPRRRGEHVYAVCFRLGGADVALLVLSPRIQIRFRGDVCDDYAFVVSPPR